LKKVSFYLVPIIICILSSNCRKDDDIKYGKDTITDAGKNNYNTVNIGTQVWMAENLKVTKFRNGDPIPNVTDSTEWSNLTTPAYCWFNNDEGNYKDTYGALFNWYTVKTGDLCPEGWHIPTDAEWTTLTTYLGGEVTAGGKLKETGTSHWFSPNTGATDETGFTARPGGYRYREHNIKFYSMGYAGLWWSCTEYDDLYARGRNMVFNLTDANRGIIPKKSGVSVRCIKD